MRRKHLGATLITCDWTGLPINCTKYYVPMQDSAGKVRKQGHFLNWNCAAAYVWHACQTGKLTEQEKWWSTNKIEEIAGHNVQLAPSFEKLGHFSVNDVQQGMSVADYVEACNTRRETIFGIYVPASALKLDAVQMVPLRPKTPDNYDYAIMAQLGCSQLASTRLLKPNFGKEKAVVMLCDAQMQSLQPNKVAQKLSKASVCGGVLFLIQHPGYNGCAKQYQSYPKEDFIQHFMKTMPVHDSLPIHEERQAKVQEVLAETAAQTEKVLQPLKKKRRTVPGKTAELPADSASEGC